MYAWKPLDTESMSAMPMIPMLPAKAVRNVRAFLVMRLLSESLRAVPMDMDLLRRPAARPPRFAGKARAAPSMPAAPAAATAAAAPIGIAPGTNGSLSLITLPSDSLTILVEYASARSGLCVTMMTSLVFEISFSMLMTWVLVSVSRAPVGSSASMISGSFIRARAMATRCTWPPDISAGFLYN